MFSYFKKPITNKTPYKDILLQDLFKAITGNYFRKTTEKARELKSINEDLYKRYKISNFDYVTFAGTFSERKIDGIKTLSGLMCLDVDHEYFPDVLKRYLIQERFLNPQLIFRSPGGDGLKIIISNPQPELKYSDSYSKVNEYFWKKYARRIDNTSDVSRACFVCYDPDAWIKDDFRLKELIKKNPMLDKMIDRLDLELIGINRIN
jgi:hypothetical protein